MPLQVLIVDDDPWFRETAKEILCARGIADAGEASDHRTAVTSPPGSSATSSAGMSDHA